MTNDQIRIEYRIDIKPSTDVEWTLGDSQDIKEYQAFKKMDDLNILFPRIEHRLVQIIWTSEERTIAVIKH